MTSVDLLLNSRSWLDNVCLLCAQLVVLEHAAIDPPVCVRVCVCYSCSLLSQQSCFSILSPVTF